MLIPATPKQRELEKEVATTFVNSSSAPSMANESNNIATRIESYSDISNELKLENLLKIKLELVG